jgi:N6-adenosine-specific RNA methylase IME4
MSAALENLAPSPIVPPGAPGLPSIDEGSPVKLIAPRQLPAGHVFAGLKANHYRCVLVDPPTRFVAGTKGRPQHYARLSDREIAALPVADLLHPEGACIFFWATSPKLFRPKTSRTLLRPDEIAEAWGARYSGRAFVWVKTKKSTANGLPFRMTADSLHRGMGYTTRKNAEDCFLFKVRAPKRLAADVDEIIIAPVREHSRKPEEAYDRTERLCAGPRVELFAREKRLGWDSWGNEVGKFAAEGVL